MSADSTHVTGSPLTGRGVPRPGTVLAERYELLEVIDAQGPSVGFRALDQESERQVLVRILSGPGVHTDACDEIVRHLRDLVGIGGRYLASLLDADREGRAPFTVEAWPRGTPLSAILDSRRRRGEALGAREALPVLAQLSAALAALPEGLHHGEVRAERVWLDTDGLRLTGPFLLAALPPDELAERVAGLDGGASAYSPESRRGLTGPAGDLWGVGAIAWEALTGRPVDLSEPAAPEVQGDLKTALMALLEEAPEDRAPDLRALLRAVALRADLSVPDLDPEPHQPPHSIVLGMEDASTEPTGPSMSEDEPAPSEAAETDSAADEDHAAPDDTTEPLADVRRKLDTLADDVNPWLADLSDEPIGSRGDDTEATEEQIDPRLLQSRPATELEGASDPSEIDFFDDGDTTVANPQHTASDTEPPPSEAPVLATTKPLPARGPSVHRPKAAPLAGPRPLGKKTRRQPLSPSQPPPPSTKGNPGARRSDAASPPKAPPKDKPAPRPQSTHPERAEADKSAPKPRGQFRPGQPGTASAKSAGGPRSRPPPKRRSTPSERRPAAPPLPLGEDTPTDETTLPDATVPKPAAATPEPAPPADSPRRSASVSGPVQRSTDPAAKLRTSGNKSRATKAGAAEATARGLAAGVSMAGYEVHEAGTVVMPSRARGTTSTPKRRRTGVVIILVAVLLAAAIIGVGFLIAGRRRADAARARELDRMLEQLRQSQEASPRQNTVSPSP